MNLRRAIFPLMVLGVAVYVTVPAGEPAAAPAATETPAPKKRGPLVGVYVCKGETMNHDIFPVLEHFEFRFRSIDREDLRALKPGDVDVLLMPGGWYFFKDEPAIADNLRKFIDAGGGYVGICCGAINACQLGLLNADMYSMYGLGPTEIEPVDGEHPVLRGIVKESPKAWRKWERFTMLRYNGWPMVLKDGAHMIAAYDMDRKLAAIASADYGKGRVVAFSPHPEGATCDPGIFADRDNTPMTYDGIKMGTAQMLDNALKWTIRWEP